MNGCRNKKQTHTQNCKQTYLENNGQNFSQHRFGNVRLMNEWDDQIDLIPRNYVRLAKFSIWICALWMGINSSGFGLDEDMDGEIAFSFV